MSQTKLIVHAGSGKTGSTAIQNFLYKNRVLLQKQGILYPDLFCDQGGIDHNWLAYSMLNSPEMRQVTGWPSVKSINIIEAINEQIHLEQPEKIILSGEAFSDVMRHDPLKLYDFLKYFDFSIILYHRPVIDAVESSYNQHIKAGNVEENCEFVNRCIKSIQENSRYKTYSAFIKLLEKDRLTLRLYNKAFLVQGDIIQDFSTIAGIDVSEIDTSLDASRSNKRIPNQYVPLFRAINTIDLDCDNNTKQNRLSVLRNYIIESGHIQSKPISMYTKAQFNQLVNISKKYDKKVLTEYMNIHDDYENFIPYFTTYSDEHPMPSQEEIAKDIILPLIDTIVELRGSTLTLSKKLSQLTNAPLISFVLKLNHYIYKSIIKIRNYFRRTAENSAIK
jgi:hypothetical protein